MQNVQPLAAGEPTEVNVTIDGVTYHFPLVRMAEIIYSMIPEWLKDSRAKIPVEAGKDQATAMVDQQRVEMARSAIKGLVAALGMLPDMGKQLYGPDFRLGRDDSMPLIAKWMTWFLVARLALAPLEIEADDAKYIKSVRRSEFNIRAGNSQEPCDNCPQERETASSSTDS